MRWRAHTQPQLMPVDQLELAASDDCGVPDDDNEVNLPVTVAATVRDVVAALKP